MGELNKGVLDYEKIYSFRDRMEKGELNESEVEEMK
jgi:hypothetical protein